MRHGVADRMELAPLPRHSGHHGLTGGTKTGVIVADDEFHAVHATLLQALEELPPMRLGLEELHARADHAPLAPAIDRRNVARTRRSSVDPLTSKVCNTAARCLPPLNTA